MQTQTYSSFFNQISFLPIFALTALLLLSGCGSDDSAGGGFTNGSRDGNDDATGASAGDVAGVAGLSQHGSTNSHSDGRRGTDCMDCHTNGTGTGVFITSGTSINGVGGYVEYYADTARTDLRARLEIDANGNFYTVTAIDILTDTGGGSLGAYVTIVMPNGSQRNMPGSINHLSASCNECHGSTQGAL